MFSPTGAPAYMMDSIVDSFNDAVASYIHLIWPNASYKITTYKTNKDASVTAKFSEELIINGQACSIGSLSGGERKSFALALDFAIIDVISKQHGINMNPIILDEPFDGLDSLGREIVVELLEHIAVSHQIIVIDHSSESKTMFSKVLKVVKQNGISSLSVE
jgi:DNA repair exonuclease SbcCD ATPase subunit